jgi:hypothetical protein
MVVVMVPIHHEESGYVRDNRKSIRKIRCEQLISSMLSAFSIWPGKFLESHW